MVAIHEQMRRQKEEAFREMEQDRRDRERREILRREHDAALARPRQVPKKPVAQPAPKPIQRKVRSSRELPFEPENDLEVELLSEYQSRSEPDPKLPAVPFYKRNGYYWIGQRRFEPVLENQVYVREGSHLTPFIEWIEKIERVESLRLKGLQSARIILLQQSSLTKHS